MLELMRRHKVKVCGNVIAAKLSEEAQTMIDEKKISELHKALQGDCDVLDVIRRF
jgi:hypothetical protein